MDVNRINGAAAAPATSPVAEHTRTAENNNNSALTDAVTAINGSKLFGQDSELTFAMDRQTRHMVIRLVDKNTRTVIRQIPAASVLQMAQDLQTD